MIPAGQHGSHGDASDSPATRNWQAIGDASRSWTGGDVAERANLHPDFQYNQSDERLGVGFLLDSSQEQRVLSMSNGTPTQHHSLPPESPARPMQAERITASWSTTPKFLGPTCPLDTLLLDFIAERSRLAATGVDAESLVGPKYPNFDPLVDPHGKHHSHEVSRVFTDILRTFPDIDRLPEQVAVVYIMFLVMRWLVQPSKENYEMMPSWVQPKPSQLFTPYPHWCSYLPWYVLLIDLLQSI